MTAEEFENKINTYQENLKRLFNEGGELEEEIQNNLKRVKYE